MGKNKENKGIQQGAVDHAPSQHGDKTISRIAEISQTSNPVEERIGPQYDPSEIREHQPKGKNRLFEDRQQHDDADKNSEKTRLARDMERHDHGPDTELHDRNVRSSAKRKN
jgi:hypothetical protein